MSRAARCAHFRRFNSLLCLWSVFLAFRLTIKMTDWGMWDWIAYSGLWIAAAIIAINGALAAAPTLRRRTPGWLRSNRWSFVPITLLALSLLAFYLSSNPPIVGGVMYMPTWGLTGPYSFKLGVPGSFQGTSESRATVDCSKIPRKYHTDFKAMIVLFHWDGREDIKDAIITSKSAKYDIEDDTIPIEIPWSSEFISEMIKGQSETNYVLLAIPSNASTDFKTIREATSLGAVVLQLSGGPP